MGADAHYVKIPDDGDLGQVGKGGSMGRLVSDDGSPKDRVHSIAPWRVQGLLLLFVMLLLIFFGSANFLVFKVMYNAYGAKYSFFVSQGVNVLYVLYGGVLVYPRMIPFFGIGDRISSAMGVPRITGEMRESPQYQYIVMGILDCFGTFFTAMGAVYTPGQFQPLLNQSLIPCTMVMSVLVLRIRYSCKQTFGAFLIVCGAAISLIPSLMQSQSSGDIRLYAVLIYWASNIPMACSAVYKESRFTAENLDVFFLTQWVSIYQLIMGFVLAPLQVIPGVGSANGTSLNEIWESFIGGWYCFLQVDGGCAERHTFLLLWAYVGLNFCFNTTGLWLTKHGGAVLNSISYALLLPLNTILWSFSFLGPYRETLHTSTFIGLIVVLCGFTIWRYTQLAAEGNFGKSMSRQTSLDTPTETFEDMPTPEAVADDMQSHRHITVSDFKERIVGIDLPLRQYSQ